jgi:hypothetical protein
MEKEKIKDEFSVYEDSGFFIECAFESMPTRKPSQVKWFIKNHFMQYKNCDYDLMRKCGAHWNKIAFDKLNNYDFQNYIHSLLTSANYRIIAKTMEQYLTFENESHG